MERVEKSYRVSFVSTEGQDVVCSVTTDTHSVIITACPFLKRFIGQTMDDLEHWITYKFDDVSVEAL